MLPPNNLLIHCLRHARTVAAVLVAIVCVPCLAVAAPVTLERVLASSAVHYPKVQEALQKLEEAQAKQQTALGGFDATLEQQGKLRTSGYYDGSVLDSQLVKPLPFANATIYSGYRYGDGEFPVYENQSYTNDAGEARMGVVFSLLRDQAIDKRRFEVQDSALEAEISQFNLVLTQLKVQYEAMQAYAEWLAAGQVLAVYEDLVNVAQERQTGLQTRAKRGDVARILLTENEQNILKRQAERNAAERDFIQKSNALSLFLRDDAGQPILPTREDMTEARTAPLEAMAPRAADIEQDIAHMLEQRPDVKLLKSSLKRQELKRRMGENQLLPEVNLGLETSRDFGDGYRNLEGTDTAAKLSVSIPLQTNTGEGMVRAANAATRQLEAQQRLLHDTLAAELRNIAADIEATRANMQLTQREVTLARKMQDAERVQFEEGASDFFLLNMREEKAAEARIKNALSQLYFTKSLASYLAATMRQAQLGMR